MTNKLETILLQKQREVAALKTSLESALHHPLHTILRGEHQPIHTHHFKHAINQQTLAVIAEIKRKSPSKGHIAAINDPVKLAQDYVSGGANALSILTDKTFFGGTVDDMRQVAHALHAPAVPILRKDFMIDKIQIAEAMLAGASAILLIVAILGTHTKSLLDYARTLGMDILVEVHDKTELMIALDSGADIIGINNRNLNTFAVDPERAMQLVIDIPKNITKVAESGITHPSAAKRYHQAGFNAVLIGEALVRASDPVSFIRACHHV